MRLECCVTTGLQEGKYYVEKYKDKIKEKLTISPFLGTLNLIPCNNKNFKQFEEHLKILEKLYIPPHNGFKGVSFVKCKILKENKENFSAYPAWITIPEIRKHSSIEIIAEINLREKLNLKDGDKVYIEIE